MQKNNLSGIEMIYVVLRRYSSIIKKKYNELMSQIETSKKSCEIK